MSEPRPEFVPLDVPPGVPMARPVLVTSAPEGALLGYAGREQSGMLTAPVRPLRALLELLALIPAFFIGSVAALVLLHTPLKGLFAKDVRLFSLATTLICALFMTTVVLLMLRLDRQPGRSIGWTTRAFWPNVGLGLVAFLCSSIALLALASFVVVFFPDLLPHTSRAQKGIEESIPPLRTAVMLPNLFFVAIWEEIVFRGFLLSRLKVILKSWWLAVPTGAIIFGSIHGYQGPFAMVQIAVMGSILGVLLVWRKSLVPGIAFHLVHNLVMFAVLRTISTNWR